MVKITNQKETKVVTMGAYNSFYKPLGFQIVTDKKEDSKKVEEVKEEKVEKKETPKKEESDVENKSDEKKKSGTENVVEKKNNKRK